MAYLENFTCPKCGNKMHMCVKSSRGWCGKCESDVEDKKRRRFLASLTGLTVDERLENLESWLYKIEGIVEKIDAATSVYTSKF